MKVLIAGQGTPLSLIHQTKQITSHILKSKDCRIDIVFDENGSSSLTEVCGIVISGRLRSVIL